MIAKNVLIGGCSVAMGILFILVRKKAYFGSSTTWRTREAAPSRGAEMICIAVGVVLIICGILGVFGLLPT